MVNETLLLTELNDASLPICYVGGSRARLSSALFQCPRMENSEKNGNRRSGEVATIDCSVKAEDSVRIGMGAL